VSYDLQVRSKPVYGKGVPLEVMASLVVTLPGVTRMGSTAFVLDRRDAGLHFSIDVGHETKDDDEAWTESPEFVNSALFAVPYPFLDTAGPLALETALQLAEQLNWSVFDLQTDCEVCRDSLPAALRLQQAAGDTARQVLERAVATDVTLGELFTQEMWNHRLWSAAACFVLATVAAGWLAIEAELPSQQINRYMPWAIAIGGFLLMWLKGLVQAVMRLRSERGRGGVPGDR
jgi:hypothetical protein